MNYPISYRATSRGNEALHMSAHAMRQKGASMGTRPAGFKPL